jgi:EAL domain-containing protein (putative c-di-GMP-specific phosphodiesterase class I)
MSVLAEGIESEDQLALLNETGCDEVQGYLFGRPKPLADLIEAGDIVQTAAPAHQDHGDAVRLALRSD